MHFRRFLESEVNVESKAAHRRHHEVVDSLIPVVGRSHRFGVERSLVVNHPQVAAYERHFDVAYVTQPAARHIVAYSNFAEADVGSVIDIVLGNCRTACDNRIPHLRVNQVAVVECDKTVVAGHCRIFRP